MLLSNFYLFKSNGFYFHFCFKVCKVKAKVSEKKIFVLFKDLLDSLDSSAQNGEAGFHDDSHSYARKRKASVPKESSEEKEKAPSDYTSEQLAAVKR